MKIFSSELCLLVLLYCCIASLAALGPLEVCRGQMTFDSEGNDVPGSIYFSRKLHVPTSASGLTLGRGYDLKKRTKTQVLWELKRAGILPKTAQKLSKAAGLTGKQAKAFIKRNNLQNFIITHEQQKRLFYITYDPIAADAKRLATKADVQKAYGMTDWNRLNCAIKEVVIDLRYRGDYTPRTRRKIQRAIAANDLAKFTKLMCDKNYWLKRIGVPKDRFLRRKNFLLKELKLLG